MTKQDAPFTKLFSVTRSANTELFAKLSELSGAQFRLIVSVLDSRDMSIGSGQHEKLPQEDATRELAKEVAALQLRCTELQKANDELRRDGPLSVASGGEKNAEGFGFCDGRHACIWISESSTKVLAWVIEIILLRVYSMVELIVFMALLCFISCWNVIFLVLAASVIAFCKFGAVVVDHLTQCSLQSVLGLLV
eukprot:CAMPEP_0197700628 /NCGR_PEP_ID=MMETSP1338-20131121/122210_1 /TAXON_ID=43686 ORGANISM="Pelagodinium beii, Strain RCC1491" /NCGR_SAMPLE_ID=MMETSP1338 /ASSEMBLY_ACC=CAM_ASM_000754 /LENGTH=193 /DNA_ID=CAMNT_0043284263 /DNA_START=21 /DNA_END=598 /DNA_ORIENTATION=-